MAVGMLRKVRFALYYLGWGLALLLGCLGFAAFLRDAGPNWTAALGGVLFLCAGFGGRH